MGAAFVAVAALISGRLRQYLENRKAFPFAGAAAPAALRCASFPFLRFPAMLRFFPSLFLFACTCGLGLSASSYGKQISFSPSLASAAPFAAPFMLSAFGAAASFACCAASLADAAQKRR